MVSVSAMSKVSLYSDGHTLLTIENINTPSDAFPGWKHTPSTRGKGTNVYLSPQNEVLYIDPDSKAVSRYVMTNGKYMKQSGGDNLLISMLNSFDTRFLIYVGDGTEPKYVVLEAEDCPHCRIHEKKDNQPHLILLGNAGADGRKSLKQKVEEGALYTCQTGKAWYDHMAANAPLENVLCGKDAAWYASQEIIGMIGFFNPTKTMGTPSVNVVPMSIGSVWWKNMQK